MGVTDTIYAWGYGDIFYNALVGVKYLFTVGDFIGLAKIVLLIAFVLVFLSLLSGKGMADPLSLIKFYIITIGIWTLFMQVKTDVFIYDLNNPNNNRTISGVPWPVAKPLSFFSFLNRKSGELMEDAMGVPDSFKYSNYGLLSSMGLLSNSMSYRVTDPYLMMSLQNYVYYCVYPDILSGYKTLDVMLTSSDMWASMGDTSAARVVRIYDSANPRGQLVNCNTAYNTISGQFSTFVSGQAMSDLAKGTFLTTTQVGSLLGTAPSLLLGYSNSAVGFLQHSIAMNLLSDTYANFARANGMDPTQYGLGLGMAEKDIQAKSALDAALGHRYLPVIKGILIVILASLTPMLFILLLTPIIMQTLGGICDNAALAVHVEYRRCDS